MCGFGISVAGGGGGGGCPPQTLVGGWAAPPPHDLTPEHKFLPTNIAILERFCMKKSKISSRHEPLCTFENSFIAGAALENPLFYSHFHFYNMKFITLCKILFLLASWNV